MKDPAYLITLKAYVAEILGRHDLLFYIEGGRSYSGELKPPKTGLLHACLLAQRADLVFVPCAISYDLVLEDFILAPQREKRQQRPYWRELAVLVRSAVGYRSRAFVTFGAPIPAAGFDPHARRDVLDLAHHIRDRIGRLMKVVPTMLLAVAMKPSATRADLEARVADLVARHVDAGANLAATDPREIVDEAARLFEARGIVVVEGNRFRVRERVVLRYYARALDHLLSGPSARAHRMLDAASKAVFQALAGSRVLRRLASRYGMASPTSFARRFIAGETL